MSPSSARGWAALAAWALALASAVGAATGLGRHALLVAIGFRALTAWRLSVAGGILWRGEAGRARTVRLASAGSALAHAALLGGALGAMALGGVWPELARACVAAQRCSLWPWATVPLALAGLAHAGWMWRLAASSRRVTLTRCQAPDILSSC